MFEHKPLARRAIAAGTSPIAAAASPRASASGALALQRSIGNVAVQRRLDDEGALSGLLGGLAGGARSAVSSAVDAVREGGAGLLSEAGAGIGSAVDTVRGMASEASTLSSEAWGGARSAAGEVGEFLGETHGQLRKDAGYVASATNWAKGGIDRLVAGQKALDHEQPVWGAGLPVLGRIGKAGRAVNDQVNQFGGGVLKTGVGLVGGLLSAAADPVDTAAGIAGMAEHLPGTGALLKPLQGAYDAVFSDKSLAQIGAEITDPTADDRYWTGQARKAWSSGSKAVTEAYRHGTLADLAGQGVSQAALLLSGLAGAGAVADAGAVTEIAGTSAATEIGGVADALAADDAVAASVLPETEAAAAESLSSDSTAAQGATAERRFPDMPIDSIGKPTGEIGAITDAEIDALIDGMDQNTKALTPVTQFVPYRGMDALREGLPAGSEPLQGLHVMPTSVGEGQGVLNYSKQDALVLPDTAEVNSAVDRSWKREFGAVARDDETRAASSVQSTIQDSFQNAEGVPQGTRDALSYRLEDEMREWGIKPTDELQPYRDREVSELPEGIDELRLDGEPPEGMGLDDSSLESPSSEPAHPNPMDGEAEFHRGLFGDDDDY
jgi:hypothetical protein